MHIRLDYQSGEAIYRQIVEQVKYMIASGELSASEQLPSIRELANQLKINPRTVVKAYDELKSAGLVVMRHGQGVFIVDSQEALPDKLRQKQIEDMSKRLLAEAARIGSPPAEVIKILKLTADKMRSKK